MATKKIDIVSSLEKLSAFMDKHFIISLEAEGIKLVKGRLAGPPPSATIPQEKPTVLSPQEKRKQEDKILFGGE